MCEKTPACDAGVKRQRWLTQLSTSGEDRRTVPVDEGTTSVRYAYSARLGKTKCLSGKKMQIERDLRGSGRVSMQDDPSVRSIDPVCNLLGDCKRIGAIFINTYSAAVCIVVWHAIHLSK
ncbi:MAG: hypothetical protein A2408_00385 [Candidatus Yonathbacteria bacterium RIFOXYC1_FULL_52_10]|uniref:Uncharacterized protein n=1 Tax=Candidatus Yonathbacteria bacterium RIFOXYD1_FULL_52_36 TaxID=1802730 RepID=A0A1G2SNJ6_9BACT|nr:MAG: hypothetical protein A2408_00385 [Candidatus Yonathbacteria bacterium RIFOXYC1_FULL_52_10]OHA86268.1 MAG: hypothetical protein A2591_01755 [Candidatus Yonathbacteria bacterium RIFOXYD1_FULL_52_36]